MKKHVLILLSFLMTVTLYSQPCVPNNYTTTGFHPDSITNLPVAVATVSYNSVITVVTQFDTLIMGTLFPIDSVGILNIYGLPISFSWVTNTPTNFWHGGTSGCILIHGNPQQSEAGVYPIKIKAKLVMAGMQIVDTIYGYRIEIIDSSFASCNDTINTSVLDTCFGFIPDTASIYNYSYLGNDSVSVTWYVSPQNGTQGGFATIIYLVDSNACFVAVLTIQCNKSTTYQFYDRLYIDDILLNINQSNEANLNFALYPNPATDNLTIETLTHSSIQILSIQGQLIKTLAASGTKTDVDHVGWSSYVVDVSALPAGVYIVQVKTEKGVAVGKFVKE